MAKHLRTSGDYTIKTGTGAGGSNSVIFDSKTTRVKGDLVVDGTRTELNTSSMSVEDPILLLSRNNSGSDIDAGLMINRDGQSGFEAGRNAAIYWNEGDNVFKAVLTTSTAAATSITDSVLAKIQVAEPTNSSDAATKTYVDAAGGVGLTGSTNNTVVTVTGANALNGEANLTFDGTTLATTGAITATTNITASGTIGNDAVSITDNNITSTRSHDDLTIDANGNGNVKINGIDFLTTGEMISKSKATALAIALG
jgi:hypothetical protein